MRGVAMPDNLSEKNIRNIQEKQKETQLLARVADLLFCEHLITPEERVRYLANLRKESEAPWMIYAR